MHTPHSEPGPFSHSAPSEKTELIPYRIQTPENGRYCTAMRHYGALTCGLSSKWWSEKHNLHHAFTNVIGADEDIIVRIAGHVDVLSSSSTAFGRVS